MDSTLAPSHFRNQMHLLGGAAFTRLKSMAETTWGGLQIQELHISEDEEGLYLSLMVRDHSFVGEVSAMGHGLQMWLQVMWFLARNSDAPTIVLDEPDVYMHADLQRKLVRLLKGSGQQIMIATHSVEIMAEVDPSEVLIIGSDRARSNWAANIKGVQRVVDTIGGVHNLQLSRLATARRCLFVEGKDVAILKPLHDKLFPDADALDLIPHLSVGGWSGWQQVIGAAQLLRNSSGDAIRSYALFDSDYHMVDEIGMRLTEASARKVELHIWMRKEIENYLLSGTCFRRIIAERVHEKAAIPSQDEMEAKIQDAANSLLQSTIDEFMNEYLVSHRSEGAQRAAQWARSHVEERLAKADGLLSVVSGKAVLSEVSTWSQNSFGVTFGAEQIARTLWREEIPQEISTVLDAVERARRFPSELAAGWQRQV